MPDAVAVRPALPEDVETLVDLLEALFSIEEDFRIDRKRQRHGLERMLNNGRGRVLAAESADGTVVGMCSGQLTVSTAEGGPAVLVEDVVVHRDWRGQGVGKALMNAIGRWARDNGARRMQLLADRNNAPALDFYTRCGWEKTRLVCLRKRLS